MSLLYMKAQDSTSLIQDQLLMLFDYWFGGFVAYIMMVFIICLNLLQIMVSIGYTQSERNTRSLAVFFVLIK